MTDDLKSRLDRLGERVPDRSDAFERLIQVRERKQRNRRRGGLAIGLAVALVGSLVAVSTLRDTATPVPRGSDTPNIPAGWQPPDVLTVWPETPLSQETAVDVQSRVDQGDPSLQWRLEFEQVADRFARTFLGWSQVSVTDEGVLDGDGPRLVSLTPCDRPETCRPYGILFLTLVQPVREEPSGIWSVSSVMTDALAIRVSGNNVRPMDPAAALSGGARIDFIVELLPDSATSAHIGFTVENGCSGAGSLTPAMGSGHHELTLPEVGPATDDCGSVGAGYVFVYVTDDTTLPVGDPLAEPTAIEFPWLAVVPIYLTMEEPGATATASMSPGASGRLSLSCSGTQVDIALDADALEVEGDPTDEMVEFADQVFAREGLGRGAQLLEGAGSTDERVFVLKIGEEQVIAAVYFERSGGDWFPAGVTYCSDVDVG